MAEITDGVLTAWPGASGDIEIPSGVTSIGNNVFYGNGDITSITIPDGVSIIGFRALASPSLERVTIPSSVTTIENNAFDSCGILNWVTLSEGLESIGQAAFYNCSGLKSITIPSTVTTLGNFAFNGCGNLKLVTFLGTPTSFGPFNAPFNECAALTTINVPQIWNSPNLFPTGAGTNISVSIVNYTLIYNAAGAVTGFTGILPAVFAIPDGVLSIGPSAFANATTITDITIPNSVTTIGVSAFSGCTGIINSITIPYTVTSVESNAFSGCTSLNTVTFESAYTTVVNDIFQDCTALTTVNGADGWTSVTTFIIDDSHVIQISGRVACFPAGTRILTPAGYRAVETLNKGDFVTTAAGLTVPVTVYSRTIKAATKNTAPYLIAAHSFGRNAPSAELRLSPLHAFQIRKGVWQSGRTANNPNVKQYAIGEDVTYYHLECPNFFRDNLVANGCVVESFAGKQVAENTIIYTPCPRLGGFTRASGRPVTAAAVKR